MLNTGLQYSSFKTDIAFLKFKQDIVNNKFWLFFFYVHAFSISICLLAGLSQFSSNFLKNNPKEHKLIGRIYFYNVMLINFPACFILGFLSNGGIIGKIGFIFQNILWGYTTYKSVQHIKNGDIKKHQIFSYFSYAITFTAITFRLNKYVFYDFNLLNYETFYGLNVCVSLFIKLIATYFFINNTILKSQKNS
jgi:hypothetical protein